MSDKVKIFTLVVLVASLGYYLYSRGYKNGVNNVQVQWDQERRDLQNYREQLRREYDQKEAEHRQETARIVHELAEAKRQNEAALLEQRLAYEHRLLLSEDRAEVYQRQAEAGSASCRDLASHAARLDRTLEEGIGLVGELKETLRFRDRQLINLGQQLLNDRSLLGENDG